LVFLALAVGVSEVEPKGTVVFRNGDERNADEIGDVVFPRRFETDLVVDSVESES
jgi:hypothetical protein